MKSQLLNDFSHLWRIIRTFQYMVKKIHNSDKCKYLGKLHEKNAVFLDKLYSNINSYNIRELEKINSDVKKEIKYIGIKLTSYSKRTKTSLLHPRLNLPIKKIKEALSAIPGEEAKEMSKMLRNNKTLPSKKSFKICHISDIHLGDFYYSPDDVSSSKGKYRILFYLADFIKDRKPDFLFISGDITSKAEKESFKIFQEYLNTLIKDKENSINLNNVIILPGNHDLYWPRTEPGNLTRFSQYFPGKIWNTPFSPSKNDFCFEIEDPYSDCKGSVFCYPEFGLIVLALDSCSFSGGIDKRIKKVYDELHKLTGISDINKIKKLFENIIHVDGGYLPTSYINKAMETLDIIFKKYEPLKNRKEWFICTVLHHSITAGFRGISTIVDKDSIENLDILSGKGTSNTIKNLSVDCIFHGHIHTTGEAEIIEKRPHIISSNTLGCLYRPRNLGLNLIEVEPAYSGEYREQKLDIYEFNGSAFTLKESYPLRPI